MENSETFDFVPLFAAAIAWLRDWLSGAGERAAWRDRNSVQEGPEMRSLLERLPSAHVRVRRLPGPEQFRFRKRSA
jgi:hypothetical protein